MPRRLYLSTAAAPVTPPAADAAWQTTASSSNITLAFTPDGTSLATVSVAEAVTTNNYSVLLRRFVSGPLAAQTINGDVIAVIRARESNAAANMSGEITVKVISNDGSTVRGTLLAHPAYTSNANEWSTTLAARAFPRTATLASRASVSSVSALDGDRLLVEVGYVAANTSATSYSGEISVGAPTSGDDLSALAETAANRGWIEFSAPVITQAEGAFSGTYASGNPASVSINDDSTSESFAHTTAIATDKTVRTTFTVATGVTGFGTVIGQAFPQFLWLWNNGTAQFYTATGYGSTGSALGSPASFALSSTDTVELRWTGGALEAWRNGALVHSATASAPTSVGTQTYLGYVSDAGQSFTIDLSALVTETFTSTALQSIAPIVRTAAPDTWRRSGNATRFEQSAVGRGGEAPPAIAAQLAPPVVRTTRADDWRPSLSVQSAVGRGAVALSYAAASIALVVTQPGDPWRPSVVVTSAVGRGVVAAPAVRPFIPPVVRTAAPDLWRPSGNATRIEQSAVGRGGVAPPSALPLIAPTVRTSQPEPWRSSVVVTSAVGRGGVAAPTARPFIAPTVRTAAPDLWRRSGQAQRIEQSAVGRGGEAPAGSPGLPPFGPVIRTIPAEPWRPSLEQASAVGLGLNLGYPGWPVVVTTGDVPWRSSVVITSAIARGTAPAPSAAPFIAPTVRTIPVTDWRPSVVVTSAVGRGGVAPPTALPIIGPVVRTAAPDLWRPSGNAQRIEQSAVGRGGEAPPAVPGLPPFVAIVRTFQPEPWVTSVIVTNDAGAANAPPPVLEVPPAAGEGPPAKGKRRRRAVPTRPVELPPIERRVEVVAEAPTIAPAAVADEPEAPPPPALAEWAPVLAALGLPAMPEGLAEAAASLGLTNLELAAVLVALLDD